MQGDQSFYISDFWECIVHEDCDYVDGAFCSSMGMCEPCSNCAVCEDGIDGDYKVCGDGFPTDETESCGNAFVFLYFQSVWMNQWVMRCWCLKNRKRFEIFFDHYFAGYLRLLNFLG